MRSIFRIPSDDMAGDAQRRVPIHSLFILGGREKCGGIFRSLPDDIAGEARRVGADSLYLY